MNRIKEELSIQNRSQGWLARQTKISYCHINKIVLDKHIPNVKTAIKIARKLNKSIEDLWFFNNGTN